MDTDVQKYLYPIHDRTLQRQAKERLLGQRGKVLWFTGLSGSGKSTLAQHLEERLFAEGHLTKLLDGDNIRTGLNNDLDFSPEARTENIRRISEVAKLFAQTGIVTLVSFISPSRAMRKAAQEIIGETDFLEVFVDTPLEVCEQRDVKGLYAKARSGEIKNFTGIDAPYEAPDAPAVRIQTANQTINESVDELFSFLVPHISG